MTPIHLALVLPVVLQAAPSPTAASSTPSPTPTGVEAPPARAPSGRVLRLNEALEVALKSQPLIHEARAQTMGQAGVAEQARSGLLPQITGVLLAERTHSTSAVSTAGTTLNTGSGSGSGTGTGTGTGTGSGTGTGTGTGTGGTTAISGVPATHDIFSGALSGTQLLYDFNQTPDKFRAANRTTQSLEATERTTEFQVLLTTRRAYFTARADKALVNVADQTVKNEEKHVVQVKGFVASGTQPEIALATELTNLANDKVSLITAQNNYEIAKAQLNQSMGVVTDTNYDVADEGLPPIQGEDGPDDALVNDALKARPELAAYERLREADVLTVRSLKGAYGPTISAIGNAGYSGLALDSLTPSWAVGAELVWPLFQGGLTKGQVHQAEANLTYVDAELETEKLQVRFDVLQAVLTLRASKVSIDASNEALTNAREQLRLAEGRYQSGVGSIIELGDAQIAATNAAAQVVQADFNLATARAQLLTALGRP